MRFDRARLFPSRSRPHAGSVPGATHCVGLTIEQDVDVAMARQAVRRLAPRGGLSTGAVHALMTAVSEIAQNIVIHAGAGELIVGVIEERGRRGVIVIGRDAGPGIADADRALQDGYSTAAGLGLGLSSARRLVDEFELVSERGRGTTVTMKKWAP